MIRTAKPIRGRINTFYVPSETIPGKQYIVHNTRHHKSHRRAMTCDCKDFTERRIFNGEVCKHIQAVVAEYPDVCRKPLQAPVCLQAHTKSATAKSALSIVVEVLNANNAESQYLWDILTALRGPDNGDVYVKHLTTAALRGAIGLKSSNYGAIINHNPLVVNGDFFNTCKEVISTLNVKSLLTPGEHFITHYAKAVVTIRRLGIA